jgi:hypothetical protein
MYRTLAPVRSVVATQSRMHAQTALLSATIGVLVRTSYSFQRAPIPLGVLVNAGGVHVDHGLATMELLRDWSDCRDLQSICQSVCLFNL